MTEKPESAKPSEPREKYSAPAGSHAEMDLHINGGTIKYTADAQWIVLRKDDKPRAESRRELSRDMAGFYDKYTK